MTARRAPEGEVEVRMGEATHGMFGAPTWQPDAEYDVVFVGVPTDAGGLGHRSPATAPSFLRTTSRLFSMVRDGRGACAGWFDYATGATLLAGARLADAGDVECPRAGGAAHLASLPAVYATLRETTKLLVVLGGDHSISYWLAQSLRDEGVVWVDAHEDARPKAGPWPDCANVVSYLDELATVPVVAQYGLRGIVPAGRAAPPPKRKLCPTPDAVVSALREGGVRSVALSVDVDVLDPSVMPAVGSPMPEGLRPADLLRLVSALREGGVRVSVLEIAEFAPTSESDVTSALVLVNFLLRALSICVG